MIPVPQSSSLLPTGEARAAFYSPVSFLRSRHDLLAAHFLRGLGLDGKGGPDDPVRTVGGAARWFVRRLDWDSLHFGWPVYRIEFCTWDDGLDDPAAALAEALAEFRIGLAAQEPGYYLFAEIPVEDSTALRGLGLAGVPIVETRVTYYREDMGRFDWPRRWSVRPATALDIPELRRVAATAVNAYDRLHADPAFPSEAANGYLATFAENSVRGFADIVLVPEDGAPAGAFLTGKFPSEEAAMAETATGKIVLAAVGKERKGWHLALMVEMSHWFRERGAGLVTMTTQATNRAVIRNCETLGYRYGRASHIFASHGSKISR